MKRLDFSRRTVFSTDPIFDELFCRRTVTAVTVIARVPACLPVAAFHIV